MTGWAWGLSIGYLIGVLQYEIADVRRVYREEKAKLNEVRRQYGLPPVKRWWLRILIGPRR